MKAIALLLFGTALAAGSGYSFLAARASESTGVAALALIGILGGVITALAGLVMNHHDHTRRR